MACATAFMSGLLGGRTIGSTSDSGSDYPGSSPGLPAKLLPARSLHQNHGRVFWQLPLVDLCGPNVGQCAEKVHGFGKTLGKVSLGDRFSSNGPPASGAS